MSKWKIIKHNFITCVKRIRIRNKITQIDMDKMFDLITTAEWRRDMEYYHDKLRYLKYLDKNGNEK